MQGYEDSYQHGRAKEEALALGVGLTLTPGTFDQWNVWAMPSGHGKRLYGGTLEGVLTFLDGFRKGRDS